MRYWERKDVMSRLCISRSASYRIVGTARGKLIASTDLLRILNASRRGPQPMLVEIPSDILTAEQMSKEIGITSRQLLNWTLRTRNLPPHFLLKSHGRRFQKSAVLGWLDKLSEIVRRG